MELSSSPFIYYLQIFGLIVFDVFFVIMIFLGMYTFVIIRKFNKIGTQVTLDAQKTISTLEKETIDLSLSIKQKIEDVNFDKLALISTIVGSTTVGLSSFFKPKSVSKNLVKSLLRILK
jgi:asparagine N-glycosylation enzyme membrane subunit Stt3